MCYSRMEPPQRSFLVYGTNGHLHVGMKLPDETSMKLKNVHHRREQCVFRGQAEQSLLLK